MGWPLAKLIDDKNEKKGKVMRDHKVPTLYWDFKRLILPV